LILVVLGSCQALTRSGYSSLEIAPWLNALGHLAKVIREIVSRFCNPLQHGIPFFLLGMVNGYFAVFKQLLFKQCGI
jgi:hypothetical protein